MCKRIYAFLLSVCFILGMVQAGWAETGESFDEKIDKLWEKYGDKDFHWEAYEKLYFAMIEKTGGPDTAGFALLPTWEQSLFIVLIMDMEIQNGGLAQFFWNNGSVYASLVPDALEEIGLEDVKKLYEDFIQDNGITMEEIDALRETDPTMTEIYTRHPFDEFDYRYMEIWAKTDLNQRFLDFAAQHPEIYDNERSAGDAPTQQPASSLKQLQEGLQTLLNLFGIQTETRRETEMTDQEVVQALQSAGIHVPDGAAEETRKRMDEWDAHAKQLGMTVFQRSAREYAANLLVAIGMGDYDFTTFSWTPTSSDVYAFDAEIFDIENMYALFLQGVQSIVPGFDIQNVTETLEENGVQPTLEERIAAGGLISEGTKTVSFSLNGHVYQKELDYYGDWFNEEAIDWINETLDAEGFEGRLYSFYDGGQGLILIYGNKEKAVQIGRLLN